MDNVIGSVSIIITGDTSRLQTDFAKAQSLAQTAGSGIAQALTSGMAPALSGASKLVDQFGRSITSGIAAPAAAAVAPVLDLEGGILRLAFANAILAREFGQVGDAAGHSVSQIQAASAAIRVGLGEQSIRAVERLLTLIPGLGAVMQAAFPILGAIALVEAISRVIGKSEDLKASEEELKRQTEATDAAFADMVKTLDSVNIKSIGRDFGPASEAKARAAALGAEAKDAENKIRDLTSQIKQIAIEAQGHPLKLVIAGFGDVNGFIQSTTDKMKAKTEEISAIQAKQAGLVAQSNDTLLEAQQKGLEQAGQFAQAKLAIQEKENASAAQMARAQGSLRIAIAHAAAEAEIRAIVDVGDRTIAEAREKVSIAKDQEAAITAALAAEVGKRIALIRQEGAARSSGKSQPEQARIGVETEGRVKEVQAEAEKERFDAHAATVRAEAAIDEAYTVATKERAAEVTRFWAAEYDKVRKKAQETFARENLPAALDTLSAQKVGEVNAKGKGETDAIAIQAQKLALERQYGTAISHTLNQQIAYMQEIARLDERAREAKTAGLRADLSILQVEAAATKSAEKQVELDTRVAQLKQQIAAADAQNKNAGFAAETGIQQTKQKGGLGAQLGQVADKGVSGLAGALAKGVTDGGKGIGKDIRKSLASIGQEMLGDVIKKSFEQMVEVILANTIATNLNTIWTELQVLIPKPFGFAAGGRPPVGVASIVGENGPELFIPDAGGTVVPNGKYGAPGLLSGSVGSAAKSQSSAITFAGDFNFHGIQDARSMMQEMAQIAKNASPKHSPWNS